jgi:hypothetical protein
VPSRPVTGAAKILGDGPSLSAKQFPQIARIVNLCVDCGDLCVFLLTMVVAALVERVDGLFVSLVSTRFGGFPFHRTPINGTLFLSAKKDSIFDFIKVT